MISIITPAYNCEFFLRNTYESLKAQTFTDWEWLVTEDFSTDDTRKILAELSEIDPRIKVTFNRSNLGAAISRNLSIDRATRDYIAFIDSDDLWMPEKLTKQVAFMKSDVPFSFTSYRLVGEDGSPLNKTIDKRDEITVGYTDMLRKKVTLGCSTVMLRRKAIGDMRMPLISAGQDYAFWLKILKAGNRAHLLPEVLMSYRIHKQSLSRNKVMKASKQWHIYREIEELSFPNALNCFAFYAIRALVR